MPQQPQQPVDIGLGLKIFPSKTVAEARADLDEQALAQQDRDITRMKLADYVADRQARQAEAKRKQEQDSFLLESLGRHTVDGKPDFDAVVKEAWTKFPDLAMTLEERLAKGRSSMVDARIKNIEAKQKSMGLGKTYLDRIVDPQTFAINAPLIAEVDPELAQTLGPQFNPELIGKLHEGYPTEVQKLDRAKAYYGSDVRSGILFDLVHADDPEDYEATIKVAEDGLLPRAMAKAIRQQFGTDTPENRQKIQAILDADEKTAAAPKVGSPEDYILSKFGPHPTPEQKLQGLREHALATRFVEPKAAGDQGRNVTSGDANRIADYKTSLNDLAVLEGSITESGATGTRAKLGAITPNWITDVTGWGTDAKKKQALIDRVKQVIGKTLEGGVLRKEDEVKYEKILPTIADVNGVVKAKLAGLATAINQRKDTTLDALEDAGYNVSRFRARDDQSAPPRPAGVPPEAVWNKETRKWVIR